MPVASEFVCTCKRHPMWSAGHDRARLFPATTVVIFVAAVFTADTTLSTPTVNVLVSHNNPVPGTAGMIAANELLPELQPYNLIASPAARALPVRFNCNVPP